MFINGIEFLTVAEMAERSGKTPNAVKLLLHKANKKPISKDALYSIEDFEVIKNSPNHPGRPKKK